MTPLPTRDDGGIDWGKIDGWRFSPAGIFAKSFLDFGQLVAAYTRERCAKCGEGVTYPYPTKESEDYRRGYHDGASDVVDIIRKMED